MNDKVFLKCSAKERTFANGGSVINIGVKADDLIAFAKTHANARGYVNLTVSPRRTAGQYGDTHSVALDDWQPTTDTGAPQQRWQGGPSGEPF